MKFFDLFSGIGGFRLGLERAGHECVGSCEIDRDARRIYGQNFGAEPEHDDAFKLDAGGLPDFDILAAGFPCQAFSLAGKRLGFADTRGTLFFEIARIARQKRPGILFLENVKGLLSHDGGRTFGTILSTLDELGYDVEWQVINGRYFLPQNRERVFIVGHLRGQPCRQIFPLGDLDPAPDTGGGPEKGGRQPTAHSIDANYWKGLDRHQQRTVIALTERRSDESKRIRRETMKAEGRDWSPRRGKVLAPRGDGVANCLTAEQSREQLLLDTAPKVSSALWQSRGFETREDGVSHCLKGQGGSAGNFVRIAASRTRDGNKHLEQNTEGSAFSLTSSGQHDNLVVACNVNETEGRSGRRFKADGEPMFALPAQSKLGVSNGQSIRRLTPTECERLQGFPDGWTEGEGISDTARYRCLGNAVMPPVIEYISRNFT